jgi:hypothetical protein
MKFCDSFKYIVNYFDDDFMNSMMILTDIVTCLALMFEIA